MIPELPACQLAPSAVYRACVVGGVCLSRKQSSASPSSLLSLPPYYSQHKTPMALPGLVHTAFRERNPHSERYHALAAAFHAETVAYFDTNSNISTRAFAGRMSREVKFTNLHFWFRNLVLVLSWGGRDDSMTNTPPFLYPPTTDQLGLASKVIDHLKLPTNRPSLLPPFLSDRRQVPHLTD